MATQALTPVEAVKEHYRLIDNASGQITAQRNVGDLTPVLADHEADASARRQAR